MSGIFYTSLVVPDERYQCCVIRIARFPDSVASPRAFTVVPGRFKEDPYTAVHPDFPELRIQGEYHEIWKQFDALLYETVERYRQEGKYLPPWWVQREEGAA